MREKENGAFDQILWIRAIAIVCFFSGAFAVLESFVGLLSYFAYVTGHVDPELNPEWYEALDTIAKTPFSFLSLNLYNIALWNGVIVCSIWLLRHKEWARRVLRALLGFDMVFTVALLAWSVFVRSERIPSPILYIALNTLQVAVIITLSHPKIIEATAMRS